MCNFLNYSCSFRKQTMAEQKENPRSLFPDGRRTFRPSSISPFPRSPGFSSRFSFKPFQQQRTNLCSRGKRPGGIQPVQDQPDPRRPSAFKRLRSAPVKPLPTRNGGEITANRLPLTGPPGLRTALGGAARVEVHLLKCFRVPGPVRGKSRVLAARRAAAK